MSELPQLKGRTYYGEPQMDLATPEGRREMHGFISEALAAAQAKGAPEVMLQRLRHDLAALTED